MQAYPCPVSARTADGHEIHVGDKAWIAIDNGTAVVNAKIIALLYSSEFESRAHFAVFATDPPRQCDLYHVFRTANECLRHARINTEMTLSHHMRQVERLAEQLGAIKVASDKGVAS